MRRRGRGILPEIGLLSSQLATVTLSRSSAPRLAVLHGGFCGQKLRLERVETLAIALVKVGCTAIYLICRDLVRASQSGAARTKSMFRQEERRYLGRRHPRRALAEDQVSERGRPRAQVFQAGSGRITVATLLGSSTL